MLVHLDAGLEVDELDELGPLGDGGVQDAALLLHTLGAVVMVTSAARTSKCVGTARVLLPLSTCRKASTSSVVRPTIATSSKGQRRRT